ncbi:MAG TPA: NBR1-Ig-like domain-containing protein, partial [Blastocatellia bacterium]|nr:NBR1-Ig-like domain-containing protein [Blastocatellia bacterium]
STNVVIQVGGGGGTNNATFVSQNVPASLTPGEIVSVSVTMRNSGTTTWSAGTYKLGSQNPENNTIWGLNRVNLSSSVAPGADATFTFNITAPATEGTYNFQWRMVQDGVGFFGDSSPNIAISVEGAPAYDAEMVSQSVPPYMVPGQSYQVSVTMRNTGTHAWGSSVGIALGSQNPEDNVTWGMNRVPLSNFVPLGGTKTFSFVVTAPSVRGIYNFQWKMFKSDIGFFGDATTNVAVVVGFSDVDPSSPFYPAINRIAELGITTGCAPGVFCPNQPVTRDQMAAFIIKALGVLNPPQPAQQRFADVPPTNLFYSFIEEMAVRGITSGCGGGNYCPSQPVTRAQMAVFLVNAFDL